jgi:hypothetical protein
VRVHALVRELLGCIEGESKRKRLPDGQITERLRRAAVQPLLQKYSDFPKSQIALYRSASRSSEGRRATSRNAERDAVDAGGALDGRGKADGEVVWS